MLLNHFSYRALPCSCRVCMHQNYEAYKSVSYWKINELTPKPNSKPRRIENDDSGIDSDKEQIEDEDVLCCYGYGLDASKSGHYGDSPKNSLVVSLHGFR